MAELSLTGPIGAARARLVRVYCLAVGALDGSTGILLIAAPELALGAMGVQEVPTDLVLLRWVGAFVGAVGLCTVYPLALRAEARDRRIATALELTAIVRLAVCAFTTGALVSGQLGLDWIPVPATDLALAVAQLWMVRSGWVRG